MKNLKANKFYFLTRDDLIHLYEIEQKTLDEIKMLFGFKTGEFYFGYRHANAEPQSETHSKSTI